eukprot:4199366-Pyramimonas_sp.AAC.1
MRAPGGCNMNPVSQISVGFQSHSDVQSTLIVRTGSFPKGILSSLPPRALLRHFSWPRLARRASKWYSKALAALASSSRILMIPVDCRA